MLNNPVQCSQTRNVVKQMPRTSSNVNNKYLISIAGEYGTRPRANIFEHVWVAKKHRPSSSLYSVFNFFVILYTDKKKIIENKSLDPFSFTNQLYLKCHIFLSFFLIISLLAKFA